MTCTSAQNIELSQSAKGFVLFSDITNRLLSIRMSMEICKNDPDAPCFKHRLRVLVVNGYKSNKALVVAYIIGVDVKSLVADNAKEV